jgi:hypothetical protein
VVGGDGGGGGVAAAAGGEAETETERYVIRIPRRPASFTGTGDLVRGAYGDADGAHDDDDA